MDEQLYADFRPEELILRDHLAVDRTILANERTFLAYIRTALYLIAAGVSFIKFFEDVAVIAVGWLFVPAGLIMFMIGIRRYRKMKGVIDAVRKLRRPPPGVGKGAPAAGA
jgi:putative membrane protein